jgi:hypothetical protein
MHDDSLSLIVEGVADADAVSARIGGDPSQKGIADATGGIFEGTVLLAGDGADVGILCDALNAKLGSKVHDPASVTGAVLAAQSMVEMSDKDIGRGSGTAALAQRVQGAEQAERVGTTGNCDDEPRTGKPERMACSGTHHRTLDARSRVHV